MLVCGALCHEKEVEQTIGIRICLLDKAISGKRPSDIDSNHLQSNADSTAVIVLGIIIA